MSKISHARHFSKRQSPASGCTSGAFYKSPRAGDNIDTSKKLKIEWDTSLHCFSSQGVDIYLNAPYTPNPVIHAWGGVSYQAGSFETDLSGPWWNSTQHVELQLLFVQSGTPAFMSPIPTGPMFQATFNSTDYGLKHPAGGSSSSTTSASAGGGGIFQVVGNAYKNSGLPKGSIIAAVIVPLLAVGVAVYLFVRFQRNKEAEKRRRWSQAVDKRMSAISSEWKGLSPNAQSEAIRQSIAIMRDSRASVARMSQLYDSRPVSTIGDGGQAGIGVGARKGTGVGLRDPNMSSSTLAARKSALSFAADTVFSRPSTDGLSGTRPSADSQRGRTSRVYQNVIAAQQPERMMSPTQVGGPPVLGDRDIQRQLDLHSDANVAPALTMMHHVQYDDGDFLHLDHSPADAGSRLVSAPTPVLLSPPAAVPFTPNTPPSPAYGSQPRSNNPFEGFARGPSNMLNPDAMLRAYASREREGSGRPGVPMIVAHPASPPPPMAHQMVTTVYPALDAPAQPVVIARGTSPAPGRTLYNPGQGQPPRVSEASRYSVTDDAYSGYGRAS